MSQFPSVEQNILRNEYLQKVTDDFHSHLDECKQCRDNPFKLCSIGHTLLLKANYPVSDK